MRVIHIGTTVWLVLCEVLIPRYLIHYGPAIYRPTGETMMIYRTDRHSLERERRQPVAWVETAEAFAWCRAQLEKPDMTAPIRADYGSSIPPVEQQRLWVAGVDPRTWQRRSGEERC